MLITFKEKRFALKDKVLKYSLIILLITFLLLSGLNNYLNLKQKNIKAEIREDLNMTQRYSRLEKSLEIENEVKKVFFSELLFLLSSYSNQLSYQSLIIDRQKIMLEGSTAKKENIIKLLELLSDDNNFKQAELKEIRAGENYDFKIETQLK